MYLFIQVYTYLNLFYLLTY